MTTVDFKNSLIALTIGLVVVSCNSGSVGTKAAKEYCECVSKESATDGGIPGLGNALVPLGCFAQIAEKYEKYFDFEEENPKFKDPQHQKDFEAALKKCSAK